VLLAAVLAALGFVVAWMAAGKTGDKDRSGGFRNPFDLFSVVGFAVSSARLSCSVARWRKHSAPPARLRALSSSGLPTSTRSPSGCCT
jgi:hypothetical protein